MPCGSLAMLTMVEQRSDGRLSIKTDGVELLLSESGDGGASNSLSEWARAAGLKWTRCDRGDPHLDASTSGARTAASQSGAAAAATVQSWSLHVERCQFMPHVDPQRTIRRAAKSNSYSTSTPTSRLLSTCCRLHRLQQQCCCRIAIASALRRDAKEGCELGRFCRCGSHASGAYSQRMGTQAGHPCWRLFTEPA